MHSCPGISRTGLLAVIACVVVAVAATVVVLGAMRGRLARSYYGNAHADQVREIHEAMLLFAHDHRGAMPVPGLIDRRPDLFLGVDKPGIGPEDPELNTTANLFSALVAQRYLQPEQLVARGERNPLVRVDDDYRYWKYDPSQDTYWDPDFVADLASGSNVSFGHLPLVGLRQRFWVAASDPRMALLGNRGPESGVASRASLSCFPNGTWAGAFVLGDGSVEIVQTPAGQPIRRAGLRDNPFVADGPPHPDTVIAFTRAVRSGAADLQHD